MNAWWPGATVTRRWSMATAAMTTTQAYEVIVIGGSFAGLSAAMQLARARRRAWVGDARPPRNRFAAVSGGLLRGGGGAPAMQLAGARRRVCVVDAGQPRNRFAAASHGFFGQDGEPPLAMIEQARRKLAAYPTVGFVQGTVVSATAQQRAGSPENGFEVVLDDGATMEAHKLVLAFGVQDGLPEIAGLRERWGASVLHCPYCHGYEFAGQRLGVLYHSSGSAMHAQLIADWGPTILFLNGDTTLESAERERLLALGITIEPAPIAALEGPGQALQGVRLQATNGGNARVVPLAALYVAATTRPARPLAAELGCAFGGGPPRPYPRTDANKITTVPGVYAAGGLTLMRHNATLASAEGVLAGVGAHQALVFGQ